MQTDVTHNLSLLHKELLRQCFTRATDLVLLATSELPTKTIKPILSIEQFPKNNRDHVNFFQRRVVQSRIGHFTTIELQHKVTTPSSIAKIKTELLPWLQEKKIYILGKDVTANELVSLGFLHGAHHSMVNKFDLADETFPQLEKNTVRSFPNFLQTTIPRKSFVSKDISLGAQTRTALRRMLSQSVASNLSLGS